MASQQGSRTALVTWVVVLAIASVTAIIFAFYYSAAATRADRELTELKKRYNDVVSEPALGGPDVGALKEARNVPDAGYSPNEKLLNVALAQRDRLAKDITGSTASPEAADAAAKSALIAAQEKLKGLKIQLPSTGDNLAGALAALTNTVVNTQGQMANLQNQLEQANLAVQNAEKRIAAIQTQTQQQLATVRQDASRQIEAAQQARSNNQGAVESATQTFAEKIKQSDAATAKANQLVAERDQKIAQMTKDLEALRTRLEGRRADVANPTLTHADGRIVRTAGGVVYIDLGTGDQVTPGLTFEVYDKGTGIPATSTSSTSGQAGTTSAQDESLPEGKASIEVIRVGPGTSECRVIRTKTGASPITEGDLIANLIYDRTAKFSFFVYGRFDLDQNGVATDQDANVVNRLITQWGGQIGKDITVDTDFVVIGAEPEIPNYSRDELQDPINAKKYADAQQELDAYQQVVNKARDLHIPILNQNRFLFYIGYYDMARR